VESDQLLEGPTLIMRKLFDSPMRRISIVCLFVSMLALTGCSITPSTNSVDYVGEYVLIPSDGSQVDYADLLILNTDQSTMGIRYSRATGQVLKTKGHWHLDTTKGEHIVIGDASYPVELSGSTIHLAINDDLHVFYEKVH
jgi:hypothetical protein